MGLIAARDEVTAQQGKKDEEISEMQDNLYARRPRTFHSADCM